MLKLTTSVMKLFFSLAVDIKRLNKVFFRRHRNLSLSFVMIGVVQGQIGFPQGLSRNQSSFICYTFVLLRHTRLLSLIFEM